MEASQEYSPPPAFNSLMAAPAGGHMEHFILPTLHDEEGHELVVRDDHNLFCLQVCAAS